MTRAQPKQLHKHSLKKLPGRALGPYQINQKLGSNAHVLESLGISLIFNVKDLTLHQGPFEPPCLSFGISPGIMSPGSHLWHNLILTFRQC